MSLTTKQAIDAHVALSELINLDKTNRLVLSSAVRIRLAGNIRKTKPLVEEYVAERNALIKKLGTPSKGNPAESEVLEGSDTAQEFKDQIKAMESEDSELTMAHVKEHELFGVTESDYKNDSRDSRKDNQVPVDLIASLQELGIVTE